jgi:hypothetical protein
VDAAAFGDFLLRQPELISGMPKVPAEIAAHAGDRRCLRRRSP